MVANSNHMTQQYQLKDDQDIIQRILKDNSTLMISEYLRCVNEIESNNYDFDSVNSLFNKSELIPTLNNLYENASDIKQFSSNEINSFAILNFSYKKELKRLEKQSLVAENEIEKTFSHMRKYLSQLPIEHSAVEINSDETIKITLSFSNDKLLMLTKSIRDNEEKSNGDEVMYSYFINRKLIASDVTNFQYFTKGFKEYISE